MILELAGVSASYEASRVLFGIDLRVDDGEVVALLGRNGMGKTTAVNSIIGLATVTEGRITFAGQAIEGWPTYRIARSGIAVVPEGRQVFPNLSVHENLVATAANRVRLARAWTIEGIYDLFPALAAIRDRSAGVLSGGEQQMLAIGRALMTNPLLLILDEATEGLAPVIRQEIWRVLGRLRALRQSVLVIDKNIAALSRVCDRYYIVEKGRIVRTGRSSELGADPDLRRSFLSVSGTSVETNPKP